MGKLIFSLFNKYKSTLHVSKLLEIKQTKTRMERLKTRMDRLKVKEGLI